MDREEFPFFVNGRFWRILGVLSINKHEGVCFPVSKHIPVPVEWSPDVPIIDTMEIFQQCHFIYEKIAEAFFLDDPEIYIGTDNNLFWTGNEQCGGLPQMNI